MEYIKKSIKIRYSKQTSFSFQIKVSFIIKTAKMTV